MADPTYRRKSDALMYEKLAADVDGLQTAMKDNTAITLEVRNILITFRTISRVAQWITAFLAAVGAVFLAFKAVAEMLV